MKPFFLLLLKPRSFCTQLKVILSAWGLFWLIAMLLLAVGGCVPCEDGHTFGLTRKACGLDRTAERRTSVCRAFCGAGHGVLEVVSSYRDKHIICTCDDNRQKEVF